jgi:hypothetical protein
MQAPAVIVNGTEADARELDAKLRAHVCSFVTSSSWRVDALPKWAAPYAKARCRGD